MSFFIFIVTIITNFQNCNFKNVYTALTLQKKMLSEELHNM